MGQGDQDHGHDHGSRRQDHGHKETKIMGQGDQDHGHDHGSSMQDLVQDLGQDSVEFGRNNPQHLDLGHDLGHVLGQDFFAGLRGIRSLRNSMSIENVWTQLQLTAEKTQILTSCSQRLLPTGGDCTTLALTYKLNMTDEF